MRTPNLYLCNGAGGATNVSGERHLRVSQRRPCWQPANCTISCPLPMLWRALARRRAGRRPSRREGERLGRQRPRGCAAAGARVRDGREAHGAQDHHDRVRGVICMTPTAIGSPGVEPDTARLVRLGSEDRGVSFEMDESAQSMLWPETQDRRLKDPEHQLLDAIANAVQARWQLLHTVRSARAIAELCVGNTVMFTNPIRPRYLEDGLPRSPRLTTARSPSGPGGRWGASANASFGARRSRCASSTAEPRSATAHCWPSASRRQYVSRRGRVRWSGKSSRGRPQLAVCHGGGGQVALLLLYEAITGYFDYRIHAEQSPEVVAAGWHSNDGASGSPGGRSDRAGDRAGIAIPDAGPPQLQTWRHRDVTGAIVPQRVGARSKRSFPTFAGWMSDPRTALAWILIAQVGACWSGADRLRLARCS